MIKKILPYLIILILLLLLIKCPSKETTSVSIPPKTNSFQTVNPEPIVLRDTIRLKGEVRIIEKENPINQELLNKYNQAKDSLEKQKLYKEAITERTYKETFEDSVQTIEVESKVIGELESQTISYTIKPNKEKIQLYGGIETNIPTQINRPFNIGLNLQLKNKNKIYKIGYDTGGNITVGVAFSIF